jgi:hypothetical protein
VGVAWYFFVFFKLQVVLIPTLLLSFYPNFLLYPCLLITISYSHPILSYSITVFYNLLLSSLPHTQTLPAVLMPPSYDVNSPQSPYFVFTANVHVMFFMQLW